MAEPTPYYLTDLGNGERFRDRHGDEFRYCAPLGSWYRYAGGRWARDEEDQARLAAQETARAIWDEVKQVHDPDEKLALCNFARRSESSRGVEAMLRESQPMLSITPERMDGNPWLLNVLNGTINLRTGRLRQHDPADYLTKLAPVAYDPAATCPLWERFIARIMDDNADLMRYMNKLDGMFLTGDITTQEVYFAWGGGANGKSVKYDTLCGLLGDYAGKAADSVLTGFGGHPTEIADLQGLRLAIGSETEEGAKLRIQLIKQLTGDQRLKARRMRQDFYEFPRTHKLLIVTNNRPRITENSEAVWRRVRLIPFSVTIPPEERDPLLIERLKAEWPGILAWCVRGCLAWQQEGLQPPAEVLIASEEYRHEQDTLSEFIADRCIRFDRARVSRAELWEVYSDWTHRTCEHHPLDRAGLFDRIRRVSGVTDKSWKVGEKSVRGFGGIGLALGSAPSEERGEEDDEVAGCRR